MQTTRIDDGKVKGFMRVRIELDDGETTPCAASTKKQWVGPGTFVRETFPDGAREERAETARVSHDYRQLG